MANESSSTGSEIAVVGMSGRFPGAANLDQFWRNLTQGVESVYRFSEEELIKVGEPAELLADPDYVRARPVLADIDRFDAAFFGFSPQDAAIMDPQHRLFLEVGWEALERAGYDPARLVRQVGVFATCGMNSYMMYHLVTNQRIMRTVGEWLVRHTGNDTSFLATSLSYYLNLTGPSLNVQCACSSALVAIHLAAQSLLSGECDMAIAGGSVVLLPQDRGYLYQQGEILARDGHCRPFDANATGTLFGSGTGAVVLRRLADALEDGDQIVAVIKGSAVNNDGSMKVGFLAPSVEGQSRVITEALAVSGVDAESVSYIEAHGTATIVGDPIEVTALTDAYRRHTDKTGYCRIGSLKSNIGHLGEAAGVAAFIKTVLSLQHRQLPPSLNYTAPNPQIDFAASPFVVNDRLTPWANGDAPRRAGVTALGAGGTNVHVIVEEAPAVPAAEPGRPEQVLVLSAKTATALEATRQNLAAALEGPDAPNLADAAYTLQVGRAAFAHRWSGVATDRETAIRALKEGGASAQVRADAPATPVAFLFPGGGVQYPNMGRGLYEREPVFRAEVDRCLTLLRARHDIDLRPILFPDDRAIEEAARELARSTHSILSIFIIEYALGKLWMSWGVTPSAMSGHSLGEYTAACLAGVFSVEDALAVVKARGDVFERLPAGSMLSVLLPERDIVPRLTGRLSMAAINAPATCVVSGPADEIAALGETLTAEGVETQRLHIDVAAHSPMLEPFLAEFRARVSSIKLSPPTLRFVSNLTGRWITSAEATDPGYWVNHLRHTVRFNDGLATLLADPSQVLLEVGPGRALTSLARSQPVKPLGLVTSLRHPNETVDDVTMMLTALGRMWTFGVEPAWSEVRGAGRRRRVALPTYPFEHQRYWIEPGTQIASATTPAAGEPAALPAAAPGSTTTKLADIADWFSVPTWVATNAPAPPTESGDAHILAFIDGAGLAAAAVAQLRKSVGGRTWLVEPGQKFAARGEDRFVLNPSNADDYVTLLNGLGAAAAEITHIVHAWSLPSAASAASTLDAELEQAFFGPLALAQALGRQELDQPISLTFLASGTAQIAGEGRVNPGRATILGPSRVLPREQANISTRVVDVVMPSTDRERDRLARTLAIEIRGAPPDARIAYRGTTRWVESFERRRLTQDAGSVLRDQGVYIITGGLGGIGFEIADHLAATVKARLVLVGRTAMPPRKDWDRWLAQHDATDATSQRIQRVLACESRGARVEVVTADVTDVRALAAVRKQALAAFGAIHGLFHAAGVLDDGLIMTKTRDAALAVLKPKVHGTAAIRTVFGRDALDFVALFSSISAVLGLQGQVDYTAANAYLDAVSDQAASETTRILSINWGPWKDVGLAVLAARGREGAGRTRVQHPWIDDIRRGPNGSMVFGLRLARDRQWMLGEHVVRGADAVLPGTGYLELARAALGELQPGRTVEVSDVLFQSPVIVGPTETKALELTFVPSGGGYECSWRSELDLYATCSVRHSDATPDAALDLAAIRTRCTERVVESAVTDGGFLAQPFMAFGRRWANIQRVHYGQGEALMSLALAAEFRDDTTWCLLHPALLDMATGGVQALIPGFDQREDFYVPVSYGCVRVFAGLPPTLYSHVRLGEGTGRDVAVFDVTITDETGAIVVDIDGFCMKRVAVQTALAHSVSTPRTDIPATSAAVAQTPAAAIANDLLTQGVLADEGLDALTRALSPGVGARVVIMPADVNAWRGRVDAAFKPTAASKRAGRQGGQAAAPGNIEQALAALWADLLGVEEVRETDDFFELGGHSLIAVRLVNRIEKLFGKRLKLGSLFEARTIRDLAGLIRGDKEASSFVSLVVVQPKGTLPPLYVVHGVGGEVLSYSELGKQLGSDQPLYAFRSVGHDGSRPPLETIEEQAAFYVQELFQHQPEGPYYLAGYSHGGRVAFEMAQQISDTGQTVAFLGVIDMWPREGVPWQLTYPVDFVLNLPSWFWVDVRLSGWSGNKDRVRRVASVVSKAVRRLLPSRNGSADRSVADSMKISHLPDHIRQTFETNFQAFMKYRPRRYSGAITLFRGKAQPLRSPQSRDLGWHDYVPDVRVIDTPGNHGSLLNMPFVQPLATRIATELAHARGDHDARQHPAGAGQPLTSPDVQ